MKPIPTILLISICVVTAVYWDDKPERAQVSNAEVSDAKHSLH